MPRDSRVYLEDIVAAASRFRRYTAGMTRAEFGADEKTAVVVLVAAEDTR